MTISNIEKPFAPACERNQTDIGKQLKRLIAAGTKRVLEIGSGTGQHAVYFAQLMPEVTWYTSDVTENHAGIKLWLDEFQLINTKPPITYEVGVDTLPVHFPDVVFSANTIHILPVHLVQQLISDLGTALSTASQVVFYGPFKYKGEFTSASNADFDQWLKDTEPHRGIRDFELINAWMQQQGFCLSEDIKMPANNQLLVFKKL